MVQYALHPLVSDRQEGSVVKVKLLADDAGYAQDGAFGALPAGMVVEVGVADAGGEALPFWFRMVRAGRAELLPDAPEPEPEPEPARPEPAEPAPRRGRPPLPRDANGNVVRE